jgi:hypothetical protein
MRHIRTRHALVGILESTTGGLIATAMFQRNWWIGGLALVLGAASITLDRLFIEDEENEVKGNNEARP